MASKRKLEVVITGDSRQLERAFGRAGKSSESFGRKLTRGAGKGMLFVGKTGAVAAVAGVAAMSVGLVKSAKAAAEAEASNARLSAQLKSMGKDTEQTRSRIEDTVQSLSRLGAFDDEDLQDAFTTLVRSSNNVSKSQKDLGLVANIARGAQVDLATAAKLVNRVNAGNVGSLKRYGIALEDGATKEEAIAALRRKFAGQAEAYSNTAAGAQEAFAIATENALEQVGVALTPLIIEFSKFAQDVLPKIAAAVSVYLGQAIDWIKRNWPQIKAILVGAWEGLRFAFTNIVLPVSRGIITAVGAIVEFFRRNMPAIKSATQSTFDWIGTNIVPTVRAVATAIGDIVAGITRVWREHGDTIKAVLRPVYNAIKEIIGAALVIIREVVEGNLALIRGDWSAVFDSLKTIVGAALRGATAVVRNIGGALVDLMLRLGKDLIDGIVRGIKARAFAVRDAVADAVGGAIEFVKTNILQAQSPSRWTMRQLGFPMIDGVVKGVKGRKSVLKETLRDIFKSAVDAARGQVASLSGTLGGMLDKIGAARIATMTSGGALTGGKTLAEIRRDQARTEREREKARLEKAVNDAQSDEDRQQAIQDLNDWLINEEARVLEEQMDQSEKAYSEDIANLQDAFDRGLISAEQFRTELEKIVGAEQGKILGDSFAAAFGQTLSTLLTTLSNLAAAGVGGAGLEAISPIGAVQGGVSDYAANKKRYDAAFGEWDAERIRRRDRVIDARNAAKTKNSPGGVDVTKAEKAAIDELENRLQNHMGRKPKPSDFGLARGGIVTGPIRTWLGENRQAEAVIPLDSGRGQAMLRKAVEGVDGLGGATIINVTVNGNEFSASDFARKLAPELRRQVTLIRSA